MRRPGRRRALAEEVNRGEDDRYMYLFLWDEWEAEYDRRIADLEVQLGRELSFVEAHRVVIQVSDEFEAAQC